MGRDDGRVKRPPLLPPPLLAKLAAAEQPPVELAQYMARLRASGVLEVKVVTGASLDPKSQPTDATAEQARTEPCVIQGRARRFTVQAGLDSSSTTTPVADALPDLVDNAQRFDNLTRFRLAATDMRLAAEAADALVEARESDGLARMWDRVIETGMVVTFARPYLDSNEAGLGRKWWPEGDDIELFDELVELRDEYHAHAAHTPRRRLEFLDFVNPGRMTVSESWEQLPVSKLRAIEELATRQTERFEAEAEKLDVELFGPKLRQSTAVASTSRRARGARALGGGANAHSRPPLLHQ